MADIFNSGIGDWFISDEQKKLNESALKDAELQRQQTEALIEYMQGKKAMASGDTGSDNKKYVIIGVAAILMIAVIVITK